MTSIAVQRAGVRGPLNLDLAADVRAGLGGEGRKRLPPRWLYDDLGSALFEAICLLPEYGLARAESRLLEDAGPALPGLLGHVPLVIELGSGAGRKSRRLLASLARRGPLVYRAVDLSAAALRACRTALRDLPGVRFAGVEADFLAGLHGAARARSAGERLLLLFLGSTIGNFEREEAAAFLRDVRQLLRADDALLLGTDLVKPVPRLLAAYDDPTGVTAAFDLNLLARLNRELRADFDLGRFAHEARWDRAGRRVEMHLRARRHQVVQVRDAGLHIEFLEGETIWTESSCKYEPDEPPSLLERAGFRCAEQWRDDAWGFALTLAVAG